MPQPLASVAPNASYSLGSNIDSPSRTRPLLALQAMNVVAEWALLEGFVNGMFVQMLESSATSSAAIFSTIRSQQGQRDAIRAVAEANLDDEMRDIVHAAMSVYERASKTRNRIVHWIWGTCEDIGDGVLLCDPLASATFAAATKEYNEKVASHNLRISDQPNLNLKKVFVYKSEDFSESSQRIQRAIHIVNRTSHIISVRDLLPRDDQLFLQLVNEPEVRQELDRLNRDRQSAP